MCGIMDYDRFLNSRIKNSKPSGIRKFFDIANEMDNVISLSIGEPDFKTPWHIRQKGIESLEKGKTWYTPNRGLSHLRDFRHGFGYMPLLSAHTPYKLFPN